MTKKADETQQRIMKAAYELFYRQGFTRVNVDAVAAHAGLTKRTLYAHFRSKDDLLAAVLEFHHELALAQIHKWTARLTGNINAMIDDLFDQLMEWASKPRWSGAGFTRIVVELADLQGHPARAIASRHKSAVEAWFAAEFAKRKVKAPYELAREVVLLIEGATALMLIHRDRSYAEAAARAAKRLAKQK